jgi:hypothetical protein
MNIPRTLMLIALFVGGWVFAEQPVPDPSTSTTGVAEKKKSQANLKLSVTKEPEREPVRIGSLDTRAWSTLVGWRPGGSACPDPKTAEGGLYLFSTGSPPPRLSDRSD